MAFDGFPDRAGDTGDHGEQGDLLLLTCRNMKYLYFKYRYFKPGGVGCPAEQRLVSGPRHSNAAEPRSPPRSRPWACRYPAAWSLSLIHISEPTRRTPISYAVFCLKKK